MRGVVFGRRWLIPHLVVALAAMGVAAGCETAQAQSQTGWQPNRKYCVRTDVTLPQGAAQLTTMANECVAASSDSDRYRAAYAAFNAARAFNEIGDTSSDPASSDALQAYASALKHIGTSLVLVSNDDPRLANESNKSKKLANDRFRLDRVNEKGRSLVGLGEPPAPGASLASAPCAITARAACYSEAISWLNKNEALTAPLAAAPGEISDDNFYYLRGRAYAASGTDAIKAMSDLQKVASQPSLAAGANSILANVSLKAGQMAARDLTNSGQNTAINFFRIAVTANPAAVEADMGLGDAYTWLGDNGTINRNDNYNSAVKYYTDTINGAADGSLQSRAYQGRGKARVALSVQPDGKNDPGMLNAAIADYNAAAGLEPRDPAPRLNLARALSKAGQLAQASTAYSQATGLMSPDSVQASAALMELGDVKSKLNAPPAEVRTAYEQAKIGNRESARPDLEIGKSYFYEAVSKGDNGSLLSNASQALQAAVNRAGGADAPPALGETDVKAEAYFYLSLVSAKRGSLLDAVKSADEAARVGAGNPAYGLHACMAHIMRGGTSVEADNSLSCAGSDGKAEGLLLRGMFYLRNAQYAATAAKGISRDTARFAFEQGLNAADRATTPAKLEDTFKWPGAPSTPPVKNLLEYGRAKSAACQGLSSTLPLSSSELRAAQSYFDFYHVEKCEPN